jgi:hypothetical protein
MVHAAQGGELLGRFLGREGDALPELDRSGLVIYTQQNDVMHDGRYNRWPVDPLAHRWLQNIANPLPVGL